MTWIWASLIEGIGKLYGAKVQATVVNKVEDAEVAAMRQDSTFKQEHDASCGMRSIQHHWKLLI